MTGAMRFVLVCLLLGMSRAAVSGRNSLSAVVVSVLVSRSSVYAILKHLIFISSYIGTFHWFHAPFVCTNTAC